ncbi:MAG TPA: CocE/NonD family hydrolase, partial [Gemmatimonadales bacterium]|nr:CocE/NonD family hydrolase [Gemmatimonadales bacterium]
LLGALPLSVARAQTSPFADCRPMPSDTTLHTALRSVFILMPDGTRLAADVFLPTGLASGKKLPTILTATRYWRAADGSQANPQVLDWIRRGYAAVVIDVRGTGASFGTWKYPWSRGEVRDLGDVVRWISTQPWSDGTVGAIGTSYTANTAQLAAATSGRPLKAVIPRFMDFDAWADLTAPGGVINSFLVREWGKAVGAMDRNTPSGNPPRGVRPIDGDSGGVLLAAAVKDHEGNPALDEVAPRAIHRDEVLPEWAGSSDDYATFRWREPIERARVPIFGWASWFDAGTSNGAISRWLTWKTPQFLVIGAWSHGGGHHASPFLAPDTPTDPSSASQQAAAACWFDRYMRGGTSGPAPGRIWYYTVGEERWKSTDVWPVRGTNQERWYLGADKVLSRTAPTGSDSDDYQVDFDATTGTQNRWYTQLGGGDVVYPDRAESDRRLLTYTTAPLDRDMEVTGNAVVTLRLTTTARDGAFFVYLEDVGPDGRVTYVTEGMLRGIHRLVTTAPYRVLYPYHSFRERDAAAMSPETMTELRFGLFPTSVQFKKGHRIRIALAGADKDTFGRIPAEGGVTWKVSRTGGAPSYVDLPVVERK